LLEDGIDVRVRLTGFSMKPLVRSGSALHFSAQPEPEVGDIVLLHYQNQCLVAHRVLKLDEQRVWTKGDSCKAADAPVERSQILATATALEAPGGVLIPLRNAGSRWIGRSMSLVYPRLVLAFRAVWPRKATKPRKDTSSCAR